MRFSASFFLLPCVLSALPSNPLLIHGEANFDFASQSLEIAGGEKAIIDWGSFSIAETEFVRFAQPSTSSIFINRVADGAPSEIFGNIQANGQIWLINPSGILVGKNACINTGSFLASTLRCSKEHPFDQQFLEFAMEKNSALKVEGKIAASEGNIILIGAETSIPGILEAPKGNVWIGAADRVVFEADRGIFIEPSPIGRIDVAGKLSGRKTKLYAQAICLDGMIDACAIENEGGKIYLVSEKGMVLVSGNLKAPSGEVRILGEKVALVGSGSIDVSGEIGGTVLLGGDFQGENPDILNADAVYISNEASIFANGARDAGKIIVWSDHSTRCLGTLSVESSLGNGGFIEISGGFLDFSGTVLGASPNGRASQLLLDPTDIEIIFPGIDNNVSASPNFAPTGPTSQLTNMTLEAALNADVFDITVASSGSIHTGAETGNITVNATVSYMSNHHLTLTTQVAGVTTGSIFVNEAIANMAGTGQIFLLSQDGVTIQGGNATPAGLSAPDGITVNALGNVQLIADGSVASAPARIDTSSGSGAVSVSCLDLTIQAGQSIGSPAEIVSGSGTTTITAQNITLNGATAGGAGGSYYDKCARIGSNSGGAVTVRASGDLSINGGTDDFSGSFLGMASEVPGFFCGDLRVIVDGDLLTQGGPSSLCEASIIGESNVISVQIGGDLQLFAGSGLTSSSLIQGRNIAPIDLTVIGDVHFQSNANSSDATVSAGNGGLSLIVTSIRGNLLVDSAGSPPGESGFISDSGTPISLNVGGNADFIANMPGDQTVVQSTGELNFNVGGNLSLSANDPGGQATISSGENANINVGGNLSIAGAGSTFILTRNNMSAFVGGNVFFDPSVTLGGMASTSGSLFLQAEGSISLSNFSAIFGLGGGPATVTVIAGRDISLSGTSQITNLFPGGEVNIVVDNLFPTSPYFGTGAFSCGPSTTVTSGSPLRIFTSQRSLNNIQGVLNGVSFAPGPFLVDSNTERWGVYYFNGFFGNEFYTIFYKTGVAQLAFAAQRAFVDAAELFRILHPYSEYIDWALHFQVSYPDIPEEPYFLRRRYSKEETFFPLN